MKVSLQKRLQLGFGAVFFFLLVIYTGHMLSRSARILAMKSDPGFTVIQIGELVLVQSPNSPEARLQLRPGDQALFINAHRIESVQDLPAVFADFPPDTAFSLTVRRNDALLPPAVLTSRAIPISAWVVAALYKLLLPLIFLVTGFVIFVLKPFEKQAVLLALMFGMFIGGLIALNPSFGGEAPGMVAVMLAVQILSLFLWPVFFHFFQTFPDPSPLLQRNPKLEKLLYIPQLVTILPYYGILNVLAAAAPQRASEFQSRFEAVDLLSFLVAIAYIAGGLLSLLVNYRQASLQSRRKMRVMVAGSIAGFAPMFLLLGLRVVFNINDHPILSWYLVATALLAFPLFPLSSAYAIVRHRVIPVGLILRRSVRYLLVARGFIFIQALAVFAVLSFLLTGSRLQFIDAYGARADIVVTMAATALAIALLTFLNQRVMPIIDRRFFREAYDAQQILSELGQEVRRSTTARQVIERAGAKIQDALHVASVGIFLRETASGDHVCIIASNFAADGSSLDTPSGLVLPGEGFVCRKLKQANFTQTIDLQRPRSWLSSLETRPETDQLVAAERGVLRRLSSALVLPIATKNELLGVVSLGPRLGDLPYSREDKQLLMAVAWQLAFAVQNAQLIEEAAEQERLRHELAIATNVQRRLFPERPPHYEKLDLAGICQPALGVGGDLYDFIVLDEHRVGIAVADVAGKGISAALLMSTVQASLRIQAEAVDGNLVELVSSMNRLLHGSTDVSNYATFFYAQFDELTGTLTYVNAGHNPPILVHTRAVSAPQAAARAANADSGAAPDPAVAARHSGPLTIGGNVIRHLTRGGPMIGAFDDCVYQQQTLQLQPGDIMVAYTDGVTEAQNDFEEEFGEDRLRDLIISSLELSAAEITEKITDEVREWCGARARQDDVTLVVMKVLA